ncbi:MAG: hypothetical protein K2K51_01725, partial [Bacteroidales bacterium]|nr:hypothetical protein [Bacteroidales bacterium]
LRPLIYYIYEEAKFFGNFFSKSFQQGEGKCLEGGFLLHFGWRASRGTDAARLRARTSRRGAALRSARLAVVSFGKTFSFRQKKRF